MYRMLLVIIIVLLTGCSANGIPSFKTDVLPTTALANTEKMFAGVPFLLAMEGSTARINEDWIITAKHLKGAYGLSYINAEVHEHPTCDVTLIKYKGTNTVPLAYLYEGGKVYNLGYPVGMLPLAVSEGSHLIDLYLDHERECRYSGTSAVVMSGMSGGGVYDHRGYLVGMNARIAREVYWGGKDTPSTMTAMLTIAAIKPWIESIIGEELILEKRGETTTNNN